MMNQPLNESAKSDRSGFVFAVALDGKGGCKSLSLSELKEKPGSKGSTWAHLDYASEETRDWLWRHSGVSHEYCEILLDPDTRPRFLQTPEGVLLILRGANLNPGSDPDDMVSIRIWLDERKMITLRHRQVMAVQAIHGQLQQGIGPKNVPACLAELILQLTVRAMNVLQDWIETLDEIEEALVDNNVHMGLKLSGLRRNFIGFHRYMAPQKEVLVSLQRLNAPLLSKPPIPAKLREISDDNLRLLEDLISAKDRASLLHEEINYRNSERMNRTLYTLGLVTAIFLPLGFVTGLLGINVDGMPGAENKTAFTWVCVILAVIAGVEYWIFKRNRWL